MIPDAAVEAAAMAILQYQRPNRPWEGWTPDGKDMWREVGRAALEAAAPHMILRPPLVQEFGSLDADRYQPRGHTGL